MLASTYPRRLLSAFIAALSLCSLNPAFAKDGVGAGGGGDTVTEMRIDAIRADILKWITEGGHQGLELPAGLTSEKYSSAMSEQLEPHAVIIGSVTSAEEAATQDPELKVLVGGQPKTCRGFLSAKDTRRHILCNVERFAATPESKQYSLIHHEYAGLAMVEQNRGASSDYSLSKQISDFLVPETVLKLSVRKAIVEKTEDEAPHMADFARDVWKTLKKHQILLPKEIQAGITSRSEFALIEVKVQTQLVEVAPDGRSSEFRMQVFPLWLSVAFDAAHPGNLAYARLRSALISSSHKKNGTAGGYRVAEGSVLLGLDGVTQSRVTGFSFVGFELSQYLDITRDGDAQLYLRGSLSASATSDLIRTLDLNDDKNSLMLGEVGVRLMKQLQISGKARLNYFRPMSGQEDVLEGFAPVLGAGLDWQFKKNMKIQGNITRMNTSDLEGNEGVTSVTGATLGVQVKFW